MKRSTVVVAAAVLAALIPALPAHASTRTDAVELRTLELINQGRPSGKVPLVMHAGLRAKAQAHSAYQSQIRGLTHDGFSTRVNTAEPDPYETNGAPDDGFRAACENVAYFYSSGGFTDEQAAKKFYDLWYNSSGHRNCLFDAWGYGLNVAGMGVYLDSRGYWWGTFLSVRDLTPPEATTEPPVPTEPPPPVPSWHRVEETDAAVVSSGTWTGVEAKKASARWYESSNTVGDSVSFTFDGTAVRWIAMTSKLGGIAEVRIDGAVVATVDLYQKPVAKKNVFFEQAGLSPGTHTIELVVTGLRNPRARDSQVFVDTFDYYG